MRHNALIPFIDLSFEAMPSKLIKKVVLGPKSTMNEADVSRYLRSNGIECNVVKSQGTYR